MAFDNVLATRLRDLFASDQSVGEKKMFGGLAFMRRGNMILGVIDDRLMARVGPDYYEEALSRPHVRPMNFSGRPMRGYVYVEPAGLISDHALEEWVGRCRAFTDTLPAK